VADWQKARFRNNPNNLEKFICTGLWKYSRHPNYLGELLMSFGLYISASSVMHGYEYLSVLSPILITILLVKFSAPMLDRAADKRWASDPAYKKYASRTPAFFPYVY
jgi:steroid 5-alpha reductase family enzyme